MSKNTVKITILVNNQAYSGLMIEHGFSLWIEHGDQRILYDTGQGITLEPNAQKLNVDLGKTDILVLSHGHYDHTGGITKVMKHNPSIDVYCHPGVVQPRYSIPKGQAPTSIGMPRESLEMINQLSSQQLQWVPEPVWLSNTIGITGPIPRKNSFEDTGGPFFSDPEGNHPDLLYDDIALWIKTDKGLVICVGCCHAGLVNTLNYIQQLNHGLNVHAIIGGFHLVNASSERLDQTISALQSIKPDMLIPCHCTGEHAVEILHNVLGRMVSPGAAGMIFSFPKQFAE